MNRLKAQMAAAMVLAATNLDSLSATVLPRELAPEPISHQRSVGNFYGHRYYGSTHKPAARRAKKKIKKASQRRNRK